MDWKKSCLTLVADDSCGMSRLEDGFVGLSADND